MLLWLLADPFADPWLEKTTLRGALAAVISFALALLLGPAADRLAARPLSRTDQNRLATRGRAARRQRSHAHDGRTVHHRRNRRQHAAVGRHAQSAGLAGRGLGRGLGRARSGRRSGQTPLRRPAALSARANSPVRPRSRWPWPWPFIPLHRHTPGALDLHSRLVGIDLSLGLGFVPLAMLVLVGSSNAVNLADGLDGLAGGCLLLGHCRHGRAWSMPAATPAGPNISACRTCRMPPKSSCWPAGVLGAILGFLWFNCYPASVFMGDTGSLPLGGLLGYFAIVCRQELMLVVDRRRVCRRSGQRAVASRQLPAARQSDCFCCAPLHHHFQFLGWPENKIVVRFWIASALAAIAGLGIVKLDAQLAADRPAATTRAQRCAAHRARTGHARGRTSSTRRAPSSTVRDPISLNR